MAAIDYVSEKREVCEFDRVIMCVNGIINLVEITQGEHESLIMKGRPDVLSKITTVVRGRVLIIRSEGSWMDKLGFALSTSFTRPAIRYTLTVKDLACLDLTGFVHARAAELRTNNLSLKLKGAGELEVCSLTAQSLAVELRGVGRIDLAGQVEEQRVTIHGPGHYKALNLKSRRARVLLEGIGSAGIWAVDRLEIKVRGLGRVGVRGTPKIRKDIAPRAPLPRFGNLWATFSD